MPIYEYQCQACGEQLERFQHRHAEPLVDCEGCGQPQLQKIISTTHFQLKGGGWYAQGYGSSNPGSSKSDSKGGNSTSSTE